MTHTYQVSNITCGGCIAKVTGLLEKLPNVTAVSVNLEGQAQITMSSHIITADLQAALVDYPKYQLSEKSVVMPLKPALVAEDDEVRGFFETYKPILLILGYILLVTMAVQFNSPSFDWMQWMQHFMAGFFLIFSFFKLLNLKGFAESYAMYDVLAKKMPTWGYVYAFVELGLGIAYLVGYNPLITNAVTIVVMSISIVGVLQSVLNKKKIQCACLGTVFNLPMSTVTIIEDALMIAMSGAMLLFG
jgi:copper chaperone CopZ